MKARGITFVVAISCMAITAIALRQCVALKYGVIRNGSPEPAISPQVQASTDGQTAPPRIPRPQTPEDVLKSHNAGAAGFDTKVRFWGKVLDQDGKPVEGASIRVSVTTLRMIKTENGYREFELLDTESKADGTFMFDGTEGFALTIEKLTKPGYVLPAPYQEAMRFPEDFKYRYPYAAMSGDGKVFHPDPASPVIYRLWKLKSPEPLTMRGSWAGYHGPKFELGGQAKLISMAFEPGGEAPPPDISIVVNSVGTEQSPQWEITVAAVEEDGGISKADPNDPFMFEAPAQGYEKVQKFRYGPEEGNRYKGGTGAPVRFFVRSKKGRWYSAADLIFFAPGATGKIVTKWRNWLNPNGSRNLEHDSANPKFFEGL